MSDFLPDIEHFVFLMLENRSFDNLMGWLYESDQPAHIIDGPLTRGTGFMGLEADTFSNRFDGDDTEHFVKRCAPTLDTPKPDPHEPYLHVNKQLFDVAVTPCGERAGASGTPPITTTEPSMSGFLADYATKRQGLGSAIADDCGVLGRVAKLLTRQISQEAALQILDTYGPEQVPVLSGLARAYAVSDHWFSSVPSQTNCNRAFSTCGTSLGLTDNAGPLFGFIPGRFDTRSIWDVLCDAGKTSPSDWMVYYQAKIFWKWVYTQRAFSIPDPDDHLAPIDDFFAAIDAGTLPRFSYLEPIWLGSHVFDNGNSYHPPAQLEPGEEFLRKLFGKLTAKPDVWSKTLLMITFDEHGGTYDHVPPPCATPPWGDSAPPDPEHGFGFDRFGVRVPTVLASPWIEERTVFRSTTDVPYDHTSMIATVLTWMGVPRDEWNLGERVACAPTFEGVITRDRPRTEVPVFGAARECGRA